MPAGLWLWDEQARPLVDTSTAIATLIGVRSGQTQPFTVVDDLFTKGIPWYFYLPRGVYSFDNPAGGFPSVAFGGNQMNVSGSGFDGTFFYGIY